MAAEQTTRVTQAKRQLERQTRRITEIDAIIKRLYEDNAIGKLSGQRFSKMDADDKREQPTPEASTIELEKVWKPVKNNASTARASLKLSAAISSERIGHGNPA